MSKTKKSQVMDGESAYAALKTRAEGLSLDVVGTTRGVNLDDAASRILGVVAMLESEPAIVLRLQSLPATELDPRHLEELRPMALALSWAAQHVKSEQAVASNALVPSHVIEVGYAIRARMLELVSYHLRRIPSCWAEIEDIRYGSGHLDLASDLDRLAKLIVDHLPALQNDTLNYVATDVTEARANAVTIRTAYNSTATAKWTDRARRVFALLDDSYSEVRAAAQFILRHEPAAEERFVPLRQAGTGRPRRLNTDASGGEVVNTTAPITTPTPGSSGTPA